jgi:hypothetical protein
MNAKTPRRQGRREERKREEGEELNHRGHRGQRDRRIEFRSLERVAVECTVYLATI